MKPDRKIVKTADGSCTLFDSEKQATFHSRHGAVAESEYVFISHGLNYLLPEKKQLKILEIGMGSGLNVLLTILAAQNKAGIDYYAVEPFPPETALLKRLDFVKAIGNLDAAELFEKIHQTQPGIPEEIVSGFRLTTFRETIQGVSLKNNIDLVYYDAFSPSHHPEMWEFEILKKVHACLNKNGVLVTFCAQGAFKRHLRALDMKVEVLPGPPGKREMTRAIA